MSSPPDHRPSRQERPALSHSRSGTLSAWTRLPLDAWLARKEYQQLATAATFVFDGSDLAPSALGGDYLFGALQKIIQNPTDIGKVAQDLENFARSAY